MSNFFETRSFSSLLNAFGFSLRERLEKDKAGIYLAHTRPGKSPETLVDHIDLVRHYFLNICNAHGLDSIVDNLLREILPGSTDLSDLSQIQHHYEFCKLIFAEAILFHDNGKLNENYQTEKMQSKEFQAIENGLGSRHAALSAFFFIVEFTRIIRQRFSSDSDQAFAFNMLVLLGTCPKLHHCAYLKSPLQLKSLFQENISSFLLYVQRLSIVDADDITLIASLMETYSPEDRLSNFLESFTDSFPLFALLKLNFSILNTADYFATAEYMLSIGHVEKGSLVQDHGIIDLNRRKIIYETFYTANPYNKSINNDAPAPPLESLQDKSFENLNSLRRIIACEVRDNVIANSKINLFYLEAPTGSGKTNASLIATVELLKSRPELNKVYYVLPFTTLITQTYGTIKRDLGLGDNEIIELHSRAGLTTTRSSPEIEGDAQYGEKKVLFMDYLFSNYPLAILSHIRFFEILKTPYKQANYMLHRLANSVVIIDELQSYNPREWDKVNYYIKEYSRLFNIVFILMSATLPKIDMLSILSKNRTNFTPLLPRKNDFFLNPNFSQRVTFDFSLLEVQNFSLEFLAYFIHKRAEEYFVKEKSVKVIIEFIFKKSASEFKKVVNKANIFSSYEILVISGSILEPQRQKIIRKMKSDNPTNEKILLIATQVVEAGVDIDCDIGFKDTSIIDSDEQLAGRVNRNAKKSNCIVYLFNYNREYIIYGNDLRYKEMLLVSEMNYREILRTKNFDLLYDKVMQHLNKNNMKSSLADNFSAYKNYFRTLNFEKLDQEFQLIKESTTSVFIPVIFEMIIFSEFELALLKSLNILPEAGYIHGESIWLLYKNICFSKKGFELKIELKSLQSILSKFMISIADFGNLKSRLLEFADINDYEKFGIIYLKDFAAIYDIETGFTFESEINNII